MNNAKVVTFAKTGAPDVMTLIDRQINEPGPREVQLRQTVIGFNYIDVYQRSGIYPVDLPSGLGHEATGIVELVGKDVKEFSVGDRVVYMNAGIGAYASQRNVAADKLILLPPHISDEQAAASFFKAMTAQYLVRKTYKVKDGDIVLIHAAAGGVGQIVAGWAKALGALVIGTVGSPDKFLAAKKAGCDVVIDYTQSDWVQQVIDASGGKKANVVYDSVAKTTFMGSLDCAAPFGMVVLFGAASGPAPEIHPEILNKKGCLYLTRPSVFPHNSTPALLKENAKEVFDAIKRGWVKVEIGARFELRDIAKAHEAAESRIISGAIVVST